MERNGDEKMEKEGGCTSTRNLIMHGRAAGEKERTRDGWREKEEKTHLRRGTGGRWRGGGVGRAKEIKNE